MSDREREEGGLGREGVYSAQQACTTPALPNIQ